MTDSRAWQVVDLSKLEPVECPCGTARRAFGDAPGGVATLHRVDISRDSRLHYHKRLTETYYVLEGEGVLEIDGETVPLAPGCAVRIPPGCRHRARGHLTILNFVAPAFDPEDEWFDQPISSDAENEA